MSEELIAECERLLGAATPGPWRWYGNMDYSDPRLLGAGPCGGTDILSDIPIDRKPDDPRIRDLDDQFDSDQVESMREEFLTDEMGEPRTDERMAFTVDGVKREARGMVIYEVAPNATERNDPKVYRADIVGIRHPDAELIAAAPSLIRQLCDALAAKGEAL